MEKLDILLVDDKLMMRKIQSEILQSIGHQVEVADSGNAAIEQAQKRPFDVILMDVQMPMMDGLQTTLRLREQGVATPIIALTGNDSAEEQVRCLQAGMNGFIAKPIQLEDFYYHIAKIFKP